MEKACIKYKLSESFLKIIFIWIKAFLYKKEGEFILKTAELRSAGAYREQKNHWTLCVRDDH